MKYNHEEVRELLNLVEAVNKPSKETVELFEKLADIQKMQAEYTKSQGKYLRAIFWAIVVIIVFIIIIIGNL